MICQVRRGDLQRVRTDIKKPCTIGREKELDRRLCLGTARNILGTVLLAL